MRFALVVGGSDGPSARHRVLAHVPRLEEANVDVTVREVPRGWFARRRFFRSLAEEDLVLVQRRLLRPGDVARLRRFSERLVFDFDDALPFHVSARGAGPSRGRRRRFESLVRAADLVIAGSEPLAELARPLNPAVQVIPTAVDTTAIRPREDDAPVGEPATLGWIGSSVTLPYLRGIVPALEAAAREEPGLRLRIVADVRLDVDGLDLDFRPWSAETEAADLAGMDVGLAPLTDDAWARGKCGFRLLQYMAAGVSAVASPVGAQAAILTDDETGRFARTPAQWTARVLELVRDREAARAMGRAARERAERSFSRRAWGPVFRDALLALMETT